MNESLEKLTSNEKIKYISYKNLESKIFKEVKLERTKNKQNSKEEYLRLKRRHKASCKKDINAIASDYKAVTVMLKEIKRQEKQLFDQDVTKLLDYLLSIKDRSKWYIKDEVLPKVSLNTRRLFYKAWQKYKFETAYNRIKSDLLKQSSKSVEEIPELAEKLAYKKIKMSCQRYKYQLGLLDSLKLFEPVYKTDLINLTDGIVGSAGRAAVAWFKKHFDYNTFKSITEQTMPAELLSKCASIYSKNVKMLGLNKRKTVIQRVNTFLMNGTVNGFLSNEKLFEHYFQIDKNNAYIHVLRHCKLPKTFKYQTDGFVPETDETYCFYFDSIGLVDRHSTDFDTGSNIIETYVFDVFEKYTFKSFYEEFLKYKNTEDKPVVKQLYTALVGMMWHDKLMLAVAIWQQNSCEIEQTAKQITANGGIIAKIHTDSIGWIGKEDMADFCIKCNNSIYKFEYKDVIICLYKSAGIYKVYDKDTGEELKFKGKKLLRIPETEYTKEENIEFDTIQEALQAREKYLQGLK